MGNVCSIIYDSIPGAGMYPLVSGSCLVFDLFRQPNTGGMFCRCIYQMPFSQIA
jgi:hypothetical protein